MTKPFNLEDEFGWVLDAVEAYGNTSSDELQHFGVKGMKWGKRKAHEPRSELKGLGPDKIVRTTKYGEEITLSKDPPPPIAKLMGRLSRSYTKEYNRGAFLTIKDSKGKKVGDAQVEKKSNDELYLLWLGINKSARGKGYASTVMKAAEEYGKTEGVKKMTLEVPGNAPDARHIYENLGFKYIGEVDGGQKDPFWGGLSEMEYTFSNVKHQESKPMNEVDDFLAHYGVAGMKWGRRKGSKTKQAEAPRAAGYTNRMQKNDRRRVGGDKGIEKIHQRVAEGKSLKKAREEVSHERAVRNGRIATAVAGGAYVAYVAGPILKAAAGMALDQAVVRKKASNGRKHAQNLFADSKGIANYETIRLSQNPTTGNWI